MSSHPRAHSVERRNVATATATDAEKTRKRAELKAQREAEQSEMQRLMQEVAELRARNAELEQRAAREEAAHIAQQARAQSLEHELNLHLADGAPAEREAADGDNNDAATAVARAPLHAQLPVAGPATIAMGQVLAARMKVTVADHPLSQVDVKDYAFSACKGPYGIATWWHEVQQLIEDAQDTMRAQTPPMPPDLALMAVKNFFAQATKKTTLGSWAAQSVGGTTRLKAFASWDEMRTAVKQKLMTPALERDMAAAFNALELKGNKLEEFVNTINTYLAVSGHTAEAAHVLMANKINACLSNRTLADLHRRNPGISLTRCNPEELDKLIETLHELVAEAEDAGIRISRAAAQPTGNAAQVKAQREEKTHGASIAAVSPGGAHTQARGGGGKGNTDKRTFLSPEERAERAIHNRVKLQGADVPTVAQRIRNKVCQVCGDKSHYSDDCLKPTFVPSN